MKRDKDISYLKLRMDRLEETTKRIEIADYNRENARLGRIVLDTANPGYQEKNQERKFLSTTPLPTLASSCSQKSRFWEVLDKHIRTKMCIIPNWKLAVFLILFVAISLLIGNAIGYGKGYTDGENAASPVCTPQMISEQANTTPMTLTQFWDWLLQLQLQPIMWALIILLILMVIR